MMFGPNSPRRHRPVMGAKRDGLLPVDFTTCSTELHLPLVTVPGMSAIPLVTPEAVAAACGDDFYAVTRWAEDQRVELTHLVGEMRTVRAAADLAEEELALEENGRSPDPPADFLAAIDEMLEAGRKRMGARTQEARRQAELRVERARSEARSILRAARPEAAPSRETSPPLSAPVELQESGGGVTPHHAEGKGIDPDDFWSAPSGCNVGFDHRETFWGELYEQQGFNPLRRFARSSS